MSKELRRETSFEDEKGNPASEDAATTVITRTFNVDGRLVSSIIQSGRDWREEKAAVERGRW
jgi:hypothetical protein